MKKRTRDAFFEAVLRGAVEDVSELVGAGANPNATDAGQRTPLMYAAIDGRPALAEFLLTAGADPNKQDRMGWTALHFAAQERHADIVAALLEAGAAVDTRDAYGNTPLWRAAFSSKGDGAVIGLLRAGGADPDLKNESGVSPRELAARIANYDVARFFR